MSVTLMVVLPAMRRLPPTLTLSLWPGVAKLAPGVPN
ncbi:hypothetical protein J2W35_004711 [Variovorax boronicumulans]|nr:hypothetical protein [Variovorax boronicumulans]